MLRKSESSKRKGQQRTRWLDGITDSKDDLEQTLGDGEGQGSLVCCSSWDCKESDMTQQLNDKKGFGKEQNSLRGLVSFSKTAFQGEITFEIQYIFLAPKDSQENMVLTVLLN